MSIPISNLISWRMLWNWNSNFLIQKCCFINSLCKLYWNFSDQVWNPFLKLRFSHLNQYRSILKETLKASILLGSFFLYEIRFFLVLKEQCPSFLLQFLKEKAVVQKVNLISAIFLIMLRVLLNRTYFSKKGLMGWWKTKVKGLWGQWIEPEDLWRHNLGVLSKQEQVAKSNG